MDSYLSFQEASGQVLFLTTCSVIFLGAVETWAALRGFSRPLAAGLIVLAISSTVFYFAGMGPVGKRVLQSSVRDSGAGAYVTAVVDATDTIHKNPNLPGLAPFFGLLAFFVITAGVVAIWQGEVWVTILRLSAGLPFGYYATEVVSWTTKLS
jgi:hypothetical protein